MLFIKQWSDIERGSDKIYTLLVLPKKKEIKLVKSELFCILFCFTFEKSVWWEPKAVKCLKYEADYSLIVITKVIFTNAYTG